MRENAKEIAQRVRGLREDSGISAQEMADYIHVELPVYKSYESGAEDFPASELSEIAGRLNVDLGLLLTGKQPKMSLISITRRARGSVVIRNKGYIYENLASSFKQVKFEPFVVTLPLNAPEEPIPLDSHPGQEFVYMLQGSMRIKVQDHEDILEVGDSAIYDSFKPHGMKAIGGDAKFIAIITA